MTYLLPNSGTGTDIYGVTDSHLSLGRPVCETVESMLKAGVRIIQYREKYLSAGRMLDECYALRLLTQKYDACFLVNDHIDIAILCQADGVHIGQDDLPVSAVRQLLGPKALIGLSTHSPEQALAACEAGADYIGVGPLFATKTKADACAPVGFAYLDWVIRHISIPFVAIGGIHRNNIESVVQHGAQCCSMISEIVSAPDIEARIAELRALMHKAKDA